LPVSEDRPQFHTHGFQVNLGIKQFTQGIQT
jgi:hypothetical protein